MVCGLLNISSVIYKSVKGVTQVPKLVDIFASAQIRCFVREDTRLPSYETFNGVRLGSGLTMSVRYWFTAK